MSITAETETETQTETETERTHPRAVSNQTPSGLPMASQAALTTAAHARATSAPIERLLATKHSWYSHYHRLIVLRPESILTIDPGTMKTTNCWMLNNMHSVRVVPSAGAFQFVIETFVPLICGLGQITLCFSHPDAVAARSFVRTMNAAIGKCSARTTGLLAARPRIGAVQRERQPLLMSPLTEEEASLPGSPLRYADAAAKDGQASPASKSPADAPKPARSPGRSPAHSPRGAGRRRATDLGSGRVVEPKPASPKLAPPVLCAPLPVASDKENLGDVPHTTAALLVKMKADRARESVMVEQAAVMRRRHSFQDKAYLSPTKNYR